MDLTTLGIVANAIAWPVVGVLAWARLTGRFK